MSLKIGVIGTPPGVMDCALSSECAKRGFVFDAAVEVCKNLNLNCTYHWFESKEYGDVDESGNGTGLVGAIQRGQFDTSVPIFTPTFNRDRAITFSDTYFYFDVLFATRRLDEKAPILNLGVIYSFQWRTWCVFISSLIFTALVVSCMIHKLNRENSNSESRGNLFGTLINTCAALVSMRGTRDRDKPSFFSKSYSKYILVFWTFASIVLTSAYTGMLFSQKLISNRELPFVDFETFVECLEKERCQIITHTTSNSAIELLIAPGSDLSTRIRQSLKKNPIKVVPLKMIPGMVLQERDVYLVWVWSNSAILYAIGGNQNCSYYTISAPYKEIYTFPLKKRSPFLSTLNSMAAPFREEELAYAMRAKYPGGEDMCQEQWNALLPSQSGVGYVNLRSMFTIFLFHALGVLAGVLAFMVEANFCKRSCVNGPEWGVNRHLRNAH